MSQDNQDFENLRRLLVLKRYEQPPPGYFNNFATQVICRLEAGEGARESAWQQLLQGAMWLQRLWVALEARPVLVGTFGATVCALLVGAAVYSETPQVQPPVFGPSAAAVTTHEMATHDPSLRQAVFDLSTPLPDQAVITGNPFLARSAQGIFPLSPEPTMTFEGFGLPGGN